MRAGRQRLAVVLGMAALALVPPVSAAFAQPYYVDLFTRIVIFAIAALSLDLIMSYGGMLSFGHAAYLGVGTYCVGIASSYGINNEIVHLLLVVVASAIVAAGIGFVSLRTSGVHFIMITLAFSQMLYFLAISVNSFGGADGMTMTQHSQLGPIPFDDANVLYYFSFGFLAVFLWMQSRIIRSRFGMVIRGARTNPRRMAALGFPVLRYQLAAFVLSGVMCGIAGALLAEQALFVSPSIMQWSRSGEIMVMVIMGGMGTLFGPILGAVVYLVLEDVLTSWTQYWALFLGPILVVIVLLGRQGVMSLIPGLMPNPRHA
ncbi:MAG TPA: branched-chain amino acid ABC transporter permease [Xanthobacteraceae bacterium]|nr:branched-chain amino acid ABC transporter permease [Xanthobacteraceae bacterium]